jgi:hypothetical protein
LGARLKIISNGGVMYRANLHHDAIVFSKNNYKSNRIILWEQLPESFKRLGAINAVIDGDTKTRIILYTCGRPIPSGWILTETNSNLCCDGGIIKIYDGIYRTFDGGG